MKILSNKNHKKPARRITAAESYGWVVETWEADEAYAMACEYFGEEDINAQIVDAISKDELAACLASMSGTNGTRTTNTTSNSGHM